MLTPQSDFETKKQNILKIEIGKFEQEKIDEFKI